MSPNASNNLPDLPEPEPLVEPDPLIAMSTGQPENAQELPTDLESFDLDLDEFNLDDPNTGVPLEDLPTVQEPVSRVSTPSTAKAAKAGGAPTQLQVQTASLLHILTNTVVELPSHLTVIHIGKPNDRVPPDIDVSGFPDSEVVSRIHADIRNEGDAYYLEDVGSSNGTYVNNLPLPKGNRHRLRPGDKISLGKGDKVSFLFQLREG
ncbi:MAG: FHA domain-containing protein [Cyanobacteriota bacterium SKYGB_h_bin112]|nr:FHA domain-containing protein [Cyanobacteriota bacterium SKYGB_h_bin112]